MADVQWIKIKVGMFDGDSFKKIKRARIGGERFRDKLTAVWFELMDFAGKCNHDGAFIDKREIPYRTLDDIATMIDRDTEELELCMSFFINEGMVEIINDVYLLSNWLEYQNEAGLAKIREQKRISQAKWREKKKLVESTVDSTEHLPSYSVSSSTSNSNSKDIDAVKVIIDYLNKKAGTAYKASSKKTKDLVSARMNEGFTVEDFQTVIDNKVDEWGQPPKAGAKDMRPYIRPETLFGTKFEAYLNQRRVNNDGEHERIGEHLI